MIITEVALCVSAAVLIFVGSLGGWLLRGLIQARSGHGNGQDTQTRRSKGRRGDGFNTRTAPCSDISRTDKVREANVDVAAGPCVRKTFSLALGHRLAESVRRGDLMSLVLARIDNFENFAERHSLQKSNEILEAVGKFFIASVRGMDWVARFDTSTFAFLLPNTAHAGALRVAERLRTTTLAAGPTVGNMQVRLTLSLGTTESTLDDTSESILRRAEDAMEASVRAGGNCIRSYVVGQCETAGMA
jgi:diguanylate cyclase (GGDEF)-like protein